jgi:hypothetical protein
LTITSIISSTVIVYPAPRKYSQINKITNGITMDYWLTTAPMGALRPEAVFVGVPPAG